MIPYEQAIEIVRNHAIRLGIETVDLTASLNRVLRQDAASDVDMPPFDKSAMDGYACRRRDLANPLEVVEIIPAGTQPQRALGENQCAKIMTGAALPAGADCVIIVEEVEEISPGRIRFRAKGTADNICRKGEDVVAGRVLVTSGSRITAKEIAALALAGCAYPAVSRRPRIGIIATGDEIIEPAGVPQGSQIRNSNSYQLLAQCIQFGCEPAYYGIAADTQAAIGAAIAAAKPANDLVLLTGGVSMGDFDLVPGILKEHGFQILFDRVAVQPGKPTVFGRVGSRYVFGLPGNPVSSFIIFELFVKELLALMMGLNGHVRTARYTLGKALTRVVSVRRAWVPVRLTPEGIAEPVEYHGSAHITSLAGADGIISLPVGVTALESGSTVEVRMI
jgi:molybdopterin molybdotransferase